MDKLLTPQQELFLSLYTNPKSETFSNAVQSALKAGYTETYANNITALMPDWLFESIGDNELLKKAEKVLKETLDYSPIDENGKIDTSLLSIQNKSAHFALERLNKPKYSARTELTGKEGKDIIFNVVNYAEETKQGEIQTVPRNLSQEEPWIKGEVEQAVDR